MRDATFPPTVRSLDDPQPEWCDLCGTMVGGSHLKLSEVEGLRGMYI